MKFVFIITCFFISTVLSGQSKYEKDLQQFFDLVKENYAYLEQQKIDVEKIRSIYTPEVKNVSNNRDFIRLLETILDEFYNGHVSLNTNLSTSNRLIPSGQDIYLEKIKDKFIITDLRKGYGAELSGLKLGDEVIAFNVKGIEEQAKLFLPRSATSYTSDMWLYVLNKLLAGTHDMKRTVTVLRNGQQLNFYPDSIRITNPKDLLEKKILDNKTAYIKINNSLGENQLIAEFDKAVDEFLGYKNLYIDLTETPGGGNSTVARCIMGRFINKPMPYQQHEFDEKDYDTKRSWVEYVTPRKQQFKGKLFILVGHWTGSMGEGIAIGFDGMKRAKIIGTKMAGLLGAIDGFVLQETKIGFQIPTERLYHVNGTARENFLPGVLTRNSDETLRKLEGGRKVDSH
jgi:C-terminal processing protease CtpA/Prc